MKSLTFDEWKALGYRVRRGEKASGRNKQGKAAFTRDQVDEDESFDRQNGLRYEQD
jgi:hypothetical protein